MTDDLTPVVVPCGRVVIRVWPDSQFLETVWPDGATVGAGPNDDAASVALAHQLGYAGDTWQLSLEHEILHTWLAVQQGEPWSPTLHAVAYQYKPARGVGWPEEDRVKALQSLLHNGTVPPHTIDALAAAVPVPLPTLVAQARAFLATLQEVPHD